MTLNLKMWLPLLLVASSLAGPQLLGGADPCRPQAAAGQRVPVPDEEVLGDHWPQLFARLDSLADSSSISWCHLEIFMLLGCGPPLLQPGRPSGQQQLLPALPWQERRVLKPHVTEAWEHKHQEKFTAIHGEEGEEAGGARIPGEAVQAPISPLTISIPDTMAHLISPCLPPRKPSELANSRPASPWGAGSSVQNGPSAST